MHPHRIVPRIAAALSLALIVAARAHAQAAAPSSVDTTAAAATPNPTVTLSPFEVQASSDKGYSALNSNGITQFNTELVKLPVSADIFDQAFMDDVGADGVEGMLQSYSAGAGYALSNPGGSASANQYLDRNANSYVSLRGVTAPTMVLDGLMPMNTFTLNGATGTGFTSNFNQEKVEVINGPQALLYGVGGAGGVVNLVSKQARLDQPAFGGFEFRVDQWGDKMGLFDYGVGTSNVAVRVALTNQTIGNRRTDIGGPMTGAYAQAAVKIPMFGDVYSILRADVTQTIWDRQLSGTPSLTASSTTNDARNGQSLFYLLFTNQIGAAANGGASGAGNILNGNINYNNVQSYAGDLDFEKTRDTFEMATLDTTWSKWLTTELVAGYRDEWDATYGGGASIVAPNVSTNPFGTWEATGSFSGLYEPQRIKVVRASAAITNDLFSGAFAAHSQTVIGADFTRNDGFVITYNYVQADGNWNPVVSTSTSNNGYTLVPTPGWAVGNGFVEYPLGIKPYQTRITYNGVNYVRVLTNDTVASLVSPGDPLGLTGSGSGDHRVGKNINRGVYTANQTTWMDGKLNTLLGIRYGYSFEENQLENGGTPASVTTESKSATVGTNVGVNYALLPWLRPYITVSNSYDPPAILSATPYGTSPAVAHAIGEEAGLKVATDDGRVSGSIAVYHTNSYNEQYSFTSSLTNDINPSGLNGRYGAVSNFINVNRESSGVQVTLTARPTDNWRMRLSAAFVRGTVATSAVADQVYNDAFHENAAGQVTYADGTVVYVAPTLNTKTPGFTQATAPAGSIPLTVALMNTSGATTAFGASETNPYFANPVTVTGQITASSGAGIVLKSSDPVHGAILTGIAGLPISDIQINPLANANNVAPPGALVLAEAGDATTGYPRLSFNYTAVYSIPYSWVKGLEVGGTVSSYWDYDDYYYYPNGVSQPNAPRILFAQPIETVFNGIFRYVHKFKRIQFSTQLNVNNMFNHYHVFLFPNAVTGYSGPNSVSFDQQPRSFTLDTKIDF